jgi:lipopolysaccharide assembly outer membrane protein LptD (OstA)
MSAERAVGNLTTGTFLFSKFKLHTGAIYCVGEKAERAPDGTISVYDVSMTTCEYIEDGHEHYSIRASRPP